MRLMNLLALAGLLAAARAGAAEYRVWLATQDDWAARKGFVLNLESAADPGPVPLKAAKLVLGVADGANWRYVTVAPEWRTGRDYEAKAVIRPDGAELFLDGARVADSPGRFAPFDGDIEAFRVPAWASGPAAFSVSQTALEASGGPGKRVTFQWAGDGRRHDRLRLFEPSAPRRAAWRGTAGEPVTVSVRFRFEPAQDLRALAPFIDRYGQAIGARFAGKVGSDAALKASVAAEAKHSKGWSAPKGYDRFGGYTKSAWRVKPTGYYGVAKRDGMWWLVSPTGYPVFYTGVCVVDMTGIEMTPIADREFLFAELPPRTGPYAKAWGHDQWSIGDNSDYVSFYTANLVRKYGAGWLPEATRQARRRLSHWGFTGIGKWTDRSFTDVPQIAVIYPSAGSNLVDHPDAFDPKVQAAYRESVRRLVEPRKRDPYLVGWSVGNENSEIIKRGEVTAILSRGADVPAKRAMIDHVLRSTYGGDAARAAAAWGVAAATAAELYAATPKPPAADIESMRALYEDAYYGMIYRSVKASDPNHLYLGNWIVPYWWESEADWAIIARHCDVVGYDRYAPTFSDANVDRWFAQANKPVLCGEYGFPPVYDGARGYGLYPNMASKDDADAGRYYERWMRAAATNPYCVGACWFEFRDQPLTGRGPGRGERLVIDEHYAFGLVDVADQPKWALVDRVRAANLSAPALRRAASRASRPVK